MLQKSEKLVCGILLVVAFIFLSINSFKEYKQTKEIPKRIERLKKEVERLAKKLEERPNEPYDEVQMARPYTFCDGDIIEPDTLNDTWIKYYDIVACVTGMVVWND